MKKKLFQNIVSYGLAEFISRIFTFIYTAYLARILGEEGFGLIGATQSYTAFFILIVQLGLDVVGTREVAKDTNQSKYWVDTIVSIRFFLSLIVFALLSSSITLLDRPFEEKILYYISGLNVFSFAFNLNWFYQGLEKGRVIAIRNIFTFSFNLIAILILVTDKSHVLIALSIIIASQLLNSALFLYYYIKFFNKLNLYWNFKEFKKIILISIPIGVTYLAVVLYQTIDMNMINFIRDNYKYETGIYYLSQKMYMISVLPSIVLQQAYLPIFSKSELNDFLINCRNYSKYQIVLGAFFSSLFLVYSKELVYLYSGDKFGESSLLVQFFMITSITAYINITYTVPLFSKGKDKEVLKAVLSGLIVNIVFNALLIPSWGVYGAVTATILCEFMVFIQLLLSFKKHYKEMLFSLHLLLIPLSILMFYGIQYFAGSLNLFIQFFILSIIYIILILIFGVVKINQLKELFSK